LNKSSSDLQELPSKSVDFIITDPPYLSNVMYSELADFFYVWLQLALQRKYKGFSSDSVRSSEEAIKDLSSESDATRYESILTKVFIECARILKDDGLLVFTFHHGSAEAWDALGESLRHAGFQVSTFYPIYSEMDVGVPILGKESVKLDAILVCEKWSGRPTEILTADQLHSYVRKVCDSLLDLFPKEFDIHAKDKKSIAQAAWTTRFTRHLTDAKASELDWDTIGNGI